jgi:predicted transcriptional regulator
MQVLWSCTAASAREIQEALPAGRHYNTVLTIIRVLERKGHVRHTEQGRGYAYSAVTPQQESRFRALGHLIEDVFGGSSESIVLNLVETGRLTLDELDAIRRKLRKSAPNKGRTK